MNSPAPDLPASSSPRTLTDVLTVSWDDTNREWEVSARPQATAEWSVFEGAEHELDTLISLARDIVTGG